jgi:hypothetical protein
MENYPRFEKVNEHIIRMIVEKCDEISMNKLIETKKQIEEKQIQLNQTLTSINEILDNAEKLGITPEEKDLTPEIKKGV